MARPQTKGAVIGIRLDLPLDQELRARSAALGKSPAEFVTELAVAYLQDQSRYRHPTARPQQQTLSDACVHKDFHKLSFGWKCDDCGAVSRDFGRTWSPAVPTGGGG